MIPCETAWPVRVVFTTHSSLKVDVPSQSGHPVRRAVFENQDSMPLSGDRGFRWGRNLVCCLTKFAPHKALKLIARVKSTFEEKVELHRGLSFIRGALIFLRIGVECELIRRSLIRMDRSRAAMALGCWVAFTFLVL